MRHRGVLSANPVLVGAVTILVTLSAVYLAYNANNGLPFVPTYQLSVRLPNASGLIAGNEVRMGGARVGVVGHIAAAGMADGSARAQLRLDLDESVGPLPADSRIRVRPRSPLGLKYVELTAGNARAMLPDGGRLRTVTRTSPVEIDDLFDTFDEPTRAGASGNLIEYGTALAGRGDDLNHAFQGLEPLARRAEGALTAINAPQARLAELFPALERAATEVAPVASQQAGMFVGLAGTYGALAAVADDIRATIAGAPRSLSVATRELRAQAPGVRATTELARRLRPGLRELGAGSTDLAAAAASGIRVLPATPALNLRLRRTLVAFDRFSRDERTRSGVQRLTRTASLLRPTVAFAAPAQTTCNYLALFFNNLQSALSESDRVGSFLRFSIVNLPQQPGSEAGPTSQPSDGPPATVPRSNQPLDSFLHSNPTPNTAAPGQPRECEAGNEPYVRGRQVIGNVPGLQAARTERTGRFEASP